MKRSLSKQYAHLAALRKSGANVLIPFAISSRLTEFKALEKSNEVIEVKPASIRVWGQLDAPKIGSTPPCDRTPNWKGRRESVLN